MVTTGSLPGPVVSTDPTGRRGTPPANRSAGTPPPARRSWTRRYLPPQHGAWAMLLVPYLAGLLLAGFSWAHLPLLVAWLGGYLLSYYAFVAVRVGRLTRVRAQVLLYAAITVPAGALVLLLSPRVIVFAPVFAVLVAVNVVAARTGSQRTLVNDLAAVLQSSLMLPVVAVAAGEPVTGVLPEFAVVLLYFAGTVPYVKTMIRNRGDVRYLVGSPAYHALALAAVGVVSWWYAVFFGWLTLRAVVAPRLPLRQLHVGLLEIVHCVVLLVLIPLAG